LDTALDSINNFRESTINSERLSTVDDEDLDADDGNSKASRHLHKATGRSQQDHASPPSKKQQMIKVKNGKAVIDKESGFAVESLTDTGLNNRQSEDDHVNTTFDGPPEPGQQTIKVSKGQVVIDKGLERRTDDITSEDRNSAVNASSPCAALHDPTQFLTSLSMENEWLDAVRAATDIPVCFIFIRGETLCLQLHYRAVTWWHQRQR